MTFRVVLSDLAKAQLRSITEWYGEHDAEVADRWLARFTHALTQLNHHPDRYALAHEAEQLGIPLREMLYGSGRKKTHRVLFVVRERSVDVVAIRHHAQHEVTRVDLGWDE